MARRAATPSPDIDLAARLFDELRAATAASEGVTRVSYGAGENLAHALLAREAARLDLVVTRDAACNLYATLPGRTAGPALIVGSHLDSVPCGGNFDGAAGVFCGLAAIAGWRRAGAAPPREVTLMAIRAEESVWFDASYIGSRAAFGLLEPSELDSVRRSDDGRTLGAHIADCGGDVAALRRGAAHLSAARIAAFIEPHIEQGPDLLARGAPIGIVTGIRGASRRREAVCHGEYAHSGATPRALRRDAVVAVAALIGELEALWSALEQDGEDATITVGRLFTDAAAHGFSKVAGRVDFSLDMRSRAQATLDRLDRELDAVAARIAQMHGVRFDLGPRSATVPAEMNAGLVDQLAGAARRRGVEAPRMACGAGHDAAVFAARGVPTGMIFIRNAHGSHNPREAMDMADFAVAAATLSDFCLAFDDAP